MTDIENCPFCGKQPELNHTFGKLVIECRYKKCTIRPSTWLAVSTDKLKVVIKAWNTRGKI